MSFNTLMLSPYIIGLTQGADGGSQGRYYQTSLLSDWGLDTTDDDIIGHVL
ncbi:MAG: hypothetical protein WBC22_02940 [Sedimentisphaerales bacterium]